MEVIRTKLDQIETETETEIKTGKNLPVKM